MPEMSAAQVKDSSDTDAMTTPPMTGMRQSHLFFDKTLP
jgi:hypothetical protein|tara:strand:+ start:306 stop:422 length:117 start_codon:yes stop_codon:yes gene_type:complete